MGDDARVNAGRRRMLLGPGGAAAAGVLGMSLVREALADDGRRRRGGDDKGSGVKYRRVIPARGYAFFDDSGKLEPLNFMRRALGDDDVAIEIAFCGVCHSDIHAALGHWGERRIPQVPGQEITGTVAAVGRRVRRFRVGDRVGVGPMVGSCGHCDDCRGGYEQYCAVDGGVVFTYGATTSDQRDPGGFTQGGYANRIVVKDDFVVKLPDALSLEDAAPMMGAATAMYSPLKHWKVGKGSRVGIVGLGGLGHLGVQIARAMGAEVTVFTTSPDKEVDAERFGARRVVVNHDVNQMRDLVRHFDFMLATVPYQFDIDPLLGTLKRDATLCMVGISRQGTPHQLNAFSMVRNRIAFAGSLFGSMAETQETLKFCVKHAIKPQVTLIVPEEINGAWPKVVDKSVRYRYVIDMRGFA